MELEDEGQVKKRLLPEMKSGVVFERRSWRWRWLVEMGRSGTARMKRNKARVERGKNKVKWGGGSNVEGLDDVGEGGCWNSG